MRSHLPPHDCEVLWQRVFGRDDAGAVPRHAGGRIATEHERRGGVLGFSHGLRAHHAGEGRRTAAFPLYFALEPGAFRGIV